MIMYGIYNSETLNALIKTVNKMYSYTTLRERTFAGKLNQLSHLYANEEGAHTVMTLHHWYYVMS